MQNLNYEYGRINPDGILVYAPSSVKLGGRIILHPTREDYAALGYYRLDDTQPSEPAPYGSHWERDGWELIDQVLHRTYKLVEDPLPGLAAYDKAMEAHLRSEREARGYTTREPDAYLESAVPRWKQDAEDWVAHRDAVMTYALAIINEVAAGTRPQPTMAEFVSGLPRIVWTYPDEAATTEG